ncbi:MAG TPA: urate oxidase, partial [Trueperaceae bacterium]
MPAKITSIDYGKAAVSVYRFAAEPLSGLTPIPESSFTGRSNALFAAEVDVRVLGDNFIPAYTEGDNRMVVATDSMKNFVHELALAYSGATLEGFLAFVGRRFLQEYPEMASLRVLGKEIAFTPARIPEGDGFADSSVLFSRSRGDYATAEVAVDRHDDELRITDLACGRRALQLIKLKGSSFASFVRDEHTTLPEMNDRPLFIHLDVGWRYQDPRQALAEDYSCYVAAEQVRDLACAVFEAFNSRSIQHLVHEMGTRLLERFPQLAEVS